MQAPILRITGTIDGYYRFALRFLDGRTIDARSSATAGQMSAVREEYVEKLHKARKALGDADPDCDLENLERFIGKVHALGAHLLFKLFDDLPSISESVADAFRASMAVEPLCSEAPAIELHTAGEMFFPVEILPLLCTEWAPLESSLKPSERRAELLRRARWFVGMSAVVRRTGDPQNGLDQASTLISKSRLPMKLFYDVGLLGAREEAAFFGQKSDRVLLDGPWPRSGNQGGKLAGFFKTVWSGIGMPGAPAHESEAELEQAAWQFNRELTGHLMNPHRTFIGDERSPPDQIHHFSCHCYRRSGDYVLRLRGANDREKHVSISDIETALVQGGWRAGEHPLPLVFLNACNSGVETAYDFASFETLFAKTRHRGLIATQTAVPDQFASRFSESFYNSLFQHHTVGQALHIARWEMLRLFQNPLGLLYNVYGNPDLRIVETLPDPGSGASTIQR